LLPVVEARTIASIRPWRLTAASKREQRRDMRD
jgi:hypothetical protein